MANAKFTPRKSSAIIPEAPAEEKEKETSVNTPKDEQNQTAGESNNSPAPEATAESEGSAEETSESTDTEKPEETEGAEESEETKEPEVKATSAVEFKPEVVVEKTTRIRSRVDHRCTIGGVHYDFVKGKTYNVPANVRDILSRNDLLSPL